MCLEWQIPVYDIAIFCVHTMHNREKSSYIYYVYITCIHELCRLCIAILHREKNFLSDVYIHGLISKTNILLLLLFFSEK